MERKLSQGLGFVEPRGNCEPFAKNGLTIAAGGTNCLLMNKSILLAASLAASFTLAACNNEPEVLDPNPDPRAAELANAAAVKPPPAIETSRAYRCKDNSLIYADFYTNGTVTVKEGQAGMPTMLTAAEGKPPYVAEGYSLSANAAQVSYTAPDKGTRSCKA